MHVWKHLFCQQFKGVQHLGLIHETTGNDQVHRANTQVVQLLHLCHQCTRAPAELGLVEQNRSSQVGFVLPIVRGCSGRALRALKVGQRGEPGC